MKRKTRKIYKKTSTRKHKGGSLYSSGGLNCSPKEDGKINPYSCYTNDSLLKMKKIWNTKHPDDLISSNNSNDIHKYLKDKLSSVCRQESCWINQEFIAGNVDDEMSGAFAPKAPKSWKKNTHEWLSNTDINRVMRQYEKAYKCFDFIGPTPIDFDKKLVDGQCVWNELCGFSLERQIKEGKKKIGIIFNTDPHDGPGEHWISLFINIKKQFIFFFDSAGEKIPPEIMKIVNRVIEQGKVQGINFKFDESYPMEHQKGDSECGMYSLYFIIYMLEDKLTGQYLKTHRIPDDFVNKYRKKFFN